MQKNDQQKIQGGTSFGFNLGILPSTITLIDLTQMLMIGIRTFLKLDCKYLGQGWIQGGGDKGD